LTFTTGLASVPNGYSRNVAIARAEEIGEERGKENAA
jgi:hypothetical protein